MGVTQAELFAVHVFYPHMVVRGESLTRDEIETLEPRIGKNGTGNVIPHLVKVTLPGSRRVQPILLESDRRPAKLSLSRVWTSRISTIEDAVALVLDRVRAVNRAYDKYSKKKKTKTANKENPDTMKKINRRRGAVILRDLKRMLKWIAARKQAFTTTEIRVANNLSEHVTGWIVEKLEKCVEGNLLIRRTQLTFEPIGATWEQLYTLHGISLESKPREPVTPVSEPRVKLGKPKLVVGQRMTEAVEHAKQVAGFAVKAKRLDRIVAIMGESWVKELLGD